VIFQVCYSQTVSPGIKNEAFSKRGMQRLDAQSWLGTTGSGILFPVAVMPGGVHGEHLMVQLMQIYEESDLLSPHEDGKWDNETYSGFTIYEINSAVFPSN